jgi:uncharacterized protein (TIGR02118 family)
MHKLVILIEPPQDEAAFEGQWPAFLHLVESLPGLQRETSSRVSHFLYGPVQVAQVHELFFETYAAAEQALASPAGRQAGHLLQQMTGGRIALFFAEHREDDIENLRRYQAGQTSE